jgi:hypothetical protein
VVKKLLLKVHRRIFYRYYLTVFLAARSRELMRENDENKVALHPESISGAMLTDS